MQTYLSSLSPSQSTNYSLWKATKSIKSPQNFMPPIRNGVNRIWARTNAEKAQMFANHLEKVFKPFPSSQVDASITDFLESPFQMHLPIKYFKAKEIKNLIARSKTKKSPGFDLITVRILKELPEIGIEILKLIFNAILRHQYFPLQWKVAQIIMISKPGKNINDVSSYRPISLLPTLSKIFEKALLKRLRPVLVATNLIPDHQFGFREKHATIEQVHRVVDNINTSFDQQKYCSAAFLDVSQAFDRVWHKGLLYKLKLKLPPQYYTILKSYLENRYFFVKVQDEQTDLFPIDAGVPQGSVLGPLLYVLFTADIPTNPNTTTATFADDTVVMATHRNPNTASKYLQDHLNSIECWLLKWRLRVNETKSTHITFTLRKETCPPVTLNSKPIPQADDTKYLGMHLDRRLTWKKHIFTKRKQLGLLHHKLYWLIGRNSHLPFGQ